MQTIRIAIKHQVRKLLRSSLIWYYSKRPLESKIVFDNMGGKGMGDDPKYIAYAIHDIDKTVKLYWLVNDMNNSFPEWIIPIRSGSYLAIRHILTAKIWIGNERNVFVYPKRKMQYYIQTWHATLGLKKAEGDVPTLPLSWQLISQEDSSKINIVYTNNKPEWDFFRNSFWYTGPILKCGIPRIAFLKKKYHESRAKIRAYYNLENKRIVLYAPTFRGTHNHTLDVYYFNYKKITDIISATFQDDFIFMIRLHPDISYLEKYMNLPDSVVAATDYPDMHELLCATDVLITDFSSCMTEFGFLRKPVFLYAKDYDEFISNDRGLLLNMSIIPYSLSKTEEELAINICKFNTESYKQKCDEFFANIEMEDDGNGDVEIAKIALSHLVD